MPIQFDNYDPQKIERLKNHLKLTADKGRAKYYEIIVDSLKAVPKTDEPGEFDGYEDYMTGDTEQIKIIIYNSGSSPRNDQYVFLLKARTREEATTIGLNGLPGSYTKTSLSSWRENLNQKTNESFEMQALRKENLDLKKELREMEEYNDQLNEAIENAKANANKIGGVHWGEVFSVAVEGLIRRNTHIIGQIPGVSGLAGIIEKDNKNPIKESPSVETEVSFKKAQSAPSLTEDEKQFIEIFRELQKHFLEDEIGQIMEILDILSKDKTLLVPTLELLQDSPPSEEEQ